MESVKSDCGPLVDRITKDLDDWMPFGGLLLVYIQMACDDNCETILLETTTREYVLI